ncbi:60S large subunit ribosomal protein uL6 (rpL9) [Andalucia godoyi]|uniref:60S large subunit ribosomal protein uL6 (RpL9) n=1 Tax=Andalucia godoyi TaxID=505711 RepID=A0A8K0AI63_ANDGO|nr:60S large subunit ribosomal protein uL6 (rpL9) [Andalucia godoyi]|eukprot:ANDGO_08625.mRNA.1 60S large subunit ribosomal protein uL6 (rpL9)
MVREIFSNQSIDMPEGVTVEVKSRVVRVKGPKGSLTKAFKHIPNLEMSTSKDHKKLNVAVWFGNKKEAACIRTVCTHVQNMATGVTKGFQYKMRFAYAHFPINAAFGEKGEWVEIRNFLGEKRTRKIDMPAGVKVIRSAIKDEVIVEGANVEDVSNSAARIHQSCLVKGKDIRKFLDGVYVSEKIVPQ